MKKYFYFIGLIGFFSCSKNQTHTPSIVELADTYYETFLETFPEETYYADIKLEKNDRITSNEVSEIAKWASFEDNLYSDLAKLDISQILERNDKITYWVLKERLESSIDMRICKTYLWTVNHRSAWQDTWLTTADFQPVANGTLRLQAISRWNKLPKYVDTEISNLKLGIKEGYTMPKEIVQLVINQLQVLLDYKIEQSPFMSPGKRAENDKFYKQWQILVESKVLPAILTYQQFLQNEYLPVARKAISISNLPNGVDCYRAFIRSYTTTNKSGEEIFETGQKIVSANKKAVAELGQKLYHNNNNNFKEIVALVRNDSTNYFNSAEEILTFNTKLIERANEESKKWFSVMPSKEATLKPYAAHESGVGSYEPATGDKPAYFRLSLKTPEKQRFDKNEVLSVHEAYPGHHLQIGIEQDLKGLHPISKISFFGSYVEGWARYSEQLAEEMELYEHQSSLISRRAWPSRGMALDPGLHLKNWSKEEVINYIMESGWSEDIAILVYHRIIIWPGQLTSYDVGGEEIKSLRKLAEKELGEKFDIKEFHTKVLENGSIPLGALRSIINEWIDAKSN